MANITVCFPIPAANWFCFRRQKVNLASILQGLRNHAAPNPDPFKSVRTSLCANIYLYGVILSSFFFFFSLCMYKRKGENEFCWLFQKYLQTSVLSRSLSGDRERDSNPAPCRLCVGAVWVMCASPCPPQAEPSPGFAVCLVERERFGFNNTKRRQTSSNHPFTVIISDQNAALHSICTEGYWYPHSFETWMARGATDTLREKLQLCEMSC